MGELAERCERALIGGMAESCRWLPGARREDWAGATALRTDLPSEQSNVLLVETSPESLETVLEKASRFFGPHAPWRMMVREPLAEGLRAEADRLRFRDLGSDPGLLLHPLGPAPLAPPDLRVELVSNARQLVDWFGVIQRVFGMPGFILRHVYPVVPSLRNDLPMGAFVGYDADARPVASSAAVVYHGVAAIYMVGTVPGARGRGFGTAMTWAALEAGRSAGADTGALNATKIGRPVYERMGFRLFDAYPQWSAPTSRFDRWRATLSLLSLAFRRPRSPLASVAGDPPSGAR